jgi:hypothetical protein
VRCAFAHQASLSLPESGLPFGSPIRPVQEWVQRLPGGIRPAAFPEERVT